MIVRSEEMIASVAIMEKFEEKLSQRRHVCQPRGGVGTVHQRLYTIRDGGLEGFAYLPQLYAFVVFSYARENLLQKHGRANAWGLGGWLPPQRHGQMS